MTCARCGHENPNEANFCSECGASLARPDDVTMTLAALDLGSEEEEAELVEQLDELAPGDAMLLVTRGSNVGSTYLLDSDITRAGRNPDNDIFLDDVTVSRKHAEFHRADEHFEIRDIGSLNGTYVNGERVEISTLNNGDEVQIGAFKLILLTGATQR